MDDLGGVLAFIFIVMAVILVVYIIVLLTSVLVTVASGAGILWGGGTALANYGKSFKENMIDSNRAAA